MKWVHFVMAFLVFTLNFMVCADTECSDHANDLSLNEIGAETGDHDAHPKLCSPFCVCGCCTTLTVVQTTFPVSGFIIQNTETPFFVESWTHHSSQNIWRPPQG